MPFAGDHHRDVETSFMRSGGGEEEPSFYTETARGTLPVLVGDRSLPSIALAAT
jgi:hypothetical protein